MNGIIHNCTHGNDPTTKLTETEMILRIFNYLDKLVQIVKPQQLLFMAIDGGQYLNVTSLVVYPLTPVLLTSHSCSIEVLAVIRWPTLTYGIGLMMRFERGIGVGACEWESSRPGAFAFVT